MGNLSILIKIALEVTDSILLVDSLVLFRLLGAGLDTLFEIRDLGFQLLLAG
jgi:hypothetical protein